MYVPGAWIRRRLAREVLRGGGWRRGLAFRALTWGPPPESPDVLTAGLPVVSESQHLWRAALAAQGSRAPKLLARLAPR